jgi:aspartate-semialdehyde dehydrogenase
MNRELHVGVVGATGAVGIEMIKTLEKRDFPVGKLTLAAYLLDCQAIYEP